MSHLENRLYDRVLGFLTPTLNVRLNRKSKESITNENLKSPEGRHNELKESNGHRKSDKSTV
jgi:hypothetical protein